MDSPVPGKNIYYFNLLHIKTQMAACCKILYLLYLLRKTFTGFSVVLLRERPVALCHGAVGLQGAREGRPTLPCAGHGQFQWPHHGGSWAPQQKWWCGRDVRLQYTRRTMGKQAVALQPVEDHSGQVSTCHPRKAHAGASSQQELRVALFPIILLYFYLAIN